MTQAQLLRYERRRIREEQRRKQLLDAIFGIVFTILLLIAFGIAGTMEYEDDMREIERWESQGIHIVRDW